MAELPLSIQQTLKALRQTYAKELPEDLRQIEAIWKGLRQRWNPEHLATLHRMIHTIAGSGATFGFSELSLEARKLEVILNGLLKRPAQEPTAEIYQETESLLSRLMQKEILEQEEAPASPNHPNALFERHDEKLIYLLDDDNTEAEYIAAQIGNFGCSVRIFKTLAEMEFALQQRSPVAIIVDPLKEGVAAVAKISENGDGAFPVIVISTQGDFISRLEAVRAGAKGYFTKPLDMASLNSKIDELISPPEAAPYRVLLIDDSPFMLAYHESILRQAGIITHGASDPLDVMNPIVEFNPDLILMDIYMPHCNGLELAAVIRQQEAHVSIPIVYLSSENDFTKQLSAMSLGGDEFLTKPIEPKHLISAVVSRSHRSRLLRSFMLRDSLTGLLNHNRVKEQLELEIARAERQSMPLSMAMLDIDFFKRVNDLYGHPVGDRVIKNLARLLQKSLRKTDIIGRYGGEEFMVVLPNTKESDALRVMDNIRAKFLAIRQQSQSSDFTTSLSGGVASYPTHGDGTALINAADNAMYQAKNSGRNRIVLAE